MEFKSNTIKKTNKTNIVETVDGSDYLLTDKVYEVCEFLEKNGEWELSGKISDCWNPQLGIKNKSELLRTIGEYLKNNWDRRANTVTPIISKLRELYTTIENADFQPPMKSYNESKEMHLRYPSNNQKYFTPQQAEKMGYFRPEYVDGSKPYEQWFNAKGQRIYVQRIDPLSDLRKNTGKSGFRMHESKTNKNVVKISENTLRQIVAESVKKVLKESAMRGLDDIGAPTHYATQDDEKIDYAMEQCAKAAMEFIMNKTSQLSEQWFKEFCERCANDGLFNTLDERQIKQCYIKGNKAAHSCVYKGNGVQYGRIPTHYNGEWQD